MGPAMVDAPCSKLEAVVMLLLGRATTDGQEYLHAGWNK